MSERYFGEGARRLSWVAARVLGWRPDEFWQATPAEFAALLAPEAPAHARPLSRAEMNRLMERDND
jgi:uncharacterized phage protein (TIGR02216 family)